jgi:low temperature requirement protein LtrA
VTVGADEERRTSPVELLWDLVFAFAVTQVTTLLRSNLTWGGFGEAMVALALIYWAWSAFVWAVNAEDASSRAVRTALLIGMGFIFVTGLALPRAFRVDHALLFVTTYAVVRFLHLALYADASRSGNASWSSIVGFAITVTIGMVLLFVGAFLHDGARAGLWASALAIDFAGPAWLTRERLRGLQEVAVAHFSERYGQFVLICLGESIIAIGTGARPLTVARVTAVVICLLITIAMWWAYFDELAETAEQRLREHDDPVLAAADAYSYIHVLLVAGIIVFAVGARQLVHASGGPLDAAGRLALCGGIALYLVGLVAFRLRLRADPEPLKLVAAIALLLVGWLGSGLHGLVVGAIVIGALAALTAIELARR